MFFPLLPLLTTVWGTTEGDTSATTDVAVAIVDAIVVATVGDGEGMTVGNVLPLNWLSKKSH